jgi:hypothetical protein
VPHLKHRRLAKDIYATNALNFPSKDPPENIEISDQLITVEEGSSSGKVLCTAEAYPEANYQWQFNNDIVATDNVLFFDYGISRHQSGEYFCVAQNRHGSTKIATKIDVLCKFRQGTLTEGEGSVHLTSSVR